MQMMLKLPEQQESQTPTIGSLTMGEAFRRLGKQRETYIYMIVGITGDIEYKIKDTSIRTVLICNLATGRVFSADAHEIIEPLPNSAVLEDSGKQLPFFGGLDKKSRRTK